MQKKIIVPIIAMLFTYGIAQGQFRPVANDDSDIPFNERFFISPDLGLQFGTVTLINISPKVGYRFTRKFSAGLGATYAYMKDKRYQFPYESNIYGGSVFAQYQLFESIRAYSEYELIKLETYDSYLNDTDREVVPSLFVGGGYSSAIGQSSSFVIMALFNLLDGPNSIYSNPVIRIGFNVGL